MNPLAADKRFFEALVAGDAQALDHILTDDVRIRDYARRVQEFLDYELKGAPAPDWWEKEVTSR